MGLALLLTFLQLMEQVLAFSKIKNKQSVVSLLVWRSWKKLDKKGFFCEYHHLMQDKEKERYLAIILLTKKKEYNPRKQQKIVHF